RSHMNSTDLISGRPTISVLTALYNKTEYIAATLRSIDRQIAASKFLVEVVVVDDCSTDDSWDIARAFRWENPNISAKFLRNERTRGPAATYNVALAACSGDYVVALDADDVLTRLSLWQRLEALEADPDLQWVTANALVMDTEGVLKPGR